MNLLRLYILRHAKSSWAMPGKSDFERGLNPRGTSDIAKIARAMVERSYLPDQIYSSSSKRTCKTIEGIKSGIGELGSPAPLPIEFVDGLYSGTLDNYLTIIKSHGNNQQSVMLVGHNPTCHNLAGLLVAGGEEKALEDLSYNFPTGALAVIDIETDSWDKIGDNAGYLQDFVLPRTL